MEANRISDSFTTLQDSLHDYTSRFRTFAEQKTSDLKDEQARLEQELISLQGELKKYETMITAFGIALGTSIFTGLVGGVMLLTPLAPLGIFVVGFSILAGLGSLSGLIYALVKQNGECN